MNVEDSGFVLRQITTRTMNKKGNQLFCLTKHWLKENVTFVFTQFLMSEKFHCPLFRDFFYSQKGARALLSSSSTFHFIMYLMRTVKKILKDLSRSELKLLFIRLHNTTPMTVCGWRYPLAGCITCSACCQGSCCWACAAWWAGPGVWPSWVWTWAASGWRSPSSR